MSTGSTMGNCTLSTAFRGSWFCPGGSGQEAPMSACPAFGSLSEHQCPSAAFSHCFLSMSPWARNGLHRELNRSLTLGGDFSWTRSKEETITYVSSKDIFICILLHPYQLQKGSAGMISKQDLVWWCSLVCFGLFFLIFCFSLLVLPFRECLDIRNRLQINVGLRDWDFFAANQVAKNTWKLQKRSRPFPAFLH